MLGSTVSSLMSFMLGSLISSKKTWQRWSFGQSGCQGNTAVGDGLFDGAFWTKVGPLRCSENSSTAYQADLVASMRIPFTAVQEIPRIKKQIRACLHTKDGVQYEFSSGAYSCAEPFHQQSLLQGFVVGSIHVTGRVLCVWQHTHTHSQCMYRGHLLQHIKPTIKISC